MVKSCLALGKVPVSVSLTAVHAWPGESDVKPLQVTLSGILNYALSMAGTFNFHKHLTDVASLTPTKPDLLFFLYE